MRARNLPRRFLAIAAAIAAPILLGPISVSADAITEWNQRALDCTAQAKQFPFVATRTMAIVHTSMFDAVNSINGRYAPYKFKVTAPAGSSEEAAAVAAAHAALVKLYPEQKASLDEAYAASLGKIPEGSGKAAGVRVGEEVAAKMIAWRASDGADAPNAYRPVTTPAAYVPTALPIGTEWGKVTPWVMANPAQFRPGPPPQLNSAEWARDYKEIKDIGAKKSASRTAEQTEIARFWMITGPSSWDPVVQELAGAAGRTLIQNARLFALVEMATADAYISVFDAKYKYNFWRPITAIRNGDTQGSNDTALEPTWEPTIETPMHPEYPCAHCITSGAARAVLEAEFGTGTFALSMSSPTAGGVTHKWSSIADYAEEISVARIYGGIHYRNSTVVGKAMGKEIGELAVQNYLKPVH